MEIDADIIGLLRNDTERLRELYRISLPLVEENGGGSERRRAEEVYRAIVERMEKRPGYPRLYLWAWRLLVHSLASEDWATLAEIYSINLKFSITIDNIEGSDISFWHLKAVLYCWVYLPMDGSLKREDRRPVPDADQLISLSVKSHFFMNLLPKEAEKKLAGFRISHFSQELRPFLFRHSTSHPGLAVLTYKGPVSDRYYHQYIKTPGQWQSLLSKGNSIYQQLYTQVVEKKTGGHEKFVQWKEIMQWIRDPLLDSQMRDDEIIRISQRLQRLLPNERKRLIVPTGDNGFSLFNECCLSSLQEVQCMPRDQVDQLGIDGSYLSNYSNNSTSMNGLQTPLVLCSGCQTENMCPDKARIERTCNRIYCNEKCYQTSLPLLY